MARRAARAILTLATAIALTGCAAPPPRSAPPPTPEPTAGAVRMAAVGDSITDGDSIDFAGGVPGPTSWVSHAVGPRVEFVDGWAEWGASTERMAEGISRPFDADVLVILAGTNDAGWRPHAEVGEQLDRIADRAGIEAVVLSSVPPIDFGGERARDLNSFLEGFADRRDWHWVDAAAGLRDGDRYAAGMSDDGVHPTEAGARVLGRAIGAAVIETG